MTVAFIGHRKIERSKELREILTETAERLIVGDNADTFLFGSKSEFNDLRYEVITELRKKYRHIRRIYVRAEYEYIDEFYAEYLSTLYEDTFFPPQVHGAGAAAYVKRNRVMIDMSDAVVVYYDAGSVRQTKSGTRAAVEYAKKKSKRILNSAEVSKSPLDK